MNNIRTYLKKYTSLPLSAIKGLLENYFLVNGIDIYDVDIVIQRKRNDNENMNLLIYEKGKIIFTLSLKSDNLGETWKIL